MSMPCAPGPVYFRLPINQVLTVLLWYSDIDTICAGPRGNSRAAHGRSPRPPMHDPNRRVPFGCSLYYNITTISGPAPNTPCLAPSTCLVLAVWPAT